MSLFWVCKTLQAVPMGMMRCTCLDPTLCAFHLAHGSMRSPRAFVEFDSVVRILLPGVSKVMSLFCIPFLLNVVDFFFSKMLQANRLMNC